tara:strand:+ start:770 stop:1504 length:735 start_codon:yes stop_codon:yes gene_type:complete
MAITGTYNFNPNVGEIMEEAFERAGANLESGNHVQSARRSLNLIALEWQNKGVNLWTVDEAVIAASSIGPGNASYNLDINTIGILDAVIRTDHGDSSLQRDLTISRMSSSTYSQITDKLSTGRPLQYWFRRIGVKGGSSGGSDIPPTVTFWPVPDELNKYTFVYWRMRRIADMDGNISNTVDVPDRFIPALISNLAYAMACKIPASMGRVPMLEAKMNKDWIEATEEDRDKEDMFITPNLSAYR